MRIFLADVADNTREFFLMLPSSACCCNLLFRVGRARRSSKHSLSTTFRGFRKTLFQNYLNTSCDSHRPQSFLNISVASIVLRYHHLGELPVAGITLYPDKTFACIDTSSSIELPLSASNPSSRNDMQDFYEFISVVAPWQKDRRVSELTRSLIFMS
jgi:hypothetical protein